MEGFVFEKELIAPCGINCGVCIAYLREKKPCAGCRIRSENKPKHCITCRIVNCDYLTKTESGFCIDCEKFPCQRMRQLDARYKKNYRMSLIGNLKLMQLAGMEDFLKVEVIKWTCPSCGKILSVHRDTCLNCKTPVDIDKRNSGN